LKQDDTGHKMGICSRPDKNFRIAMVAEGSNGDNTACLFKVIFTRANQISVFLQAVQSLAPAILVFNAK
jgi:hypothetical protein